MKAYKLIFVLLIAALFVSPLFCVNSSLFNPGKQGQTGHFTPRLSSQTKDRPLTLDMAKFFYYPEEWAIWYQLYGVGCISASYEYYDNNEWFLVNETVVDRVDGKPITATSTDFTETPNQIGRYEYTYTANSQNQPATITSSYYSGNQWNFDRRQTYSYNEYGGVTQVTVEEYYNGGGWVMVEQAICASTMDRLTHVLSTEYNFDQMIWENSMNMSLTWTGNLVNEVIEQGWSGSEWENGSKTAFTYTDQDYLQQVTFEEWVHTSGVWQADGRITYTFVDGLWMEELIEEYNYPLGWKGVMSYNTVGYPISQLGYERQNDSWVLVERTSFSYDGSDIIDNTTPNVPLVITNYPNPFVSTTAVTYKLPQSAQTELCIYNVRGQLVRNLVNEPLTSGQHTVSWDGKDDNGNSLASGMYLGRITSAGKQETHKMLLMK